MASPTVSLESIFNIIQIIVEEGRYKLILDVDGANLNATMDKDIYIWLDPPVTKILISIAPMNIQSIKMQKAEF